MPDGTAHRPLEPLTMDHLRWWTPGLILDNGQPCVLQSFQEDFADALLSGVREVLFEAPEGNAKTTTVAVLLLYLAHYRRAWRILVAAAARDQAMEIFLQAKGFADRDERLEAIYNFQEGNRRIAGLHSRTRIQFKGSDEKIGQGPIPNLCVLDELCHQKDMGLYRTWDGKLEKRGGQIVGLSNAGEPGHEYEQFKDATFRDAEVEERGPGYQVARRPGVAFFRHALRDSDDLTDLELVKTANPIAQVTVAKLERKFNGAAMTATQWARMTCGVAKRVAAHAVPPQVWKAVPVEVIPVGQPIWLGMDLGWVWDTTALAPFWWKSKTCRIFGTPKILVPPRQEGQSLKPEEVRTAVREIHGVNPIEVAVIDIAAEGRVIAEFLEEEIGCRVVSYGQTNEPQAVARERFMEALRENYFRRPPESKARREMDRQVGNAVAVNVLSTRARFDRPSATRQGGNQDLRVIDWLTAGSGVHAAAVAEHDGPKRTGPKINLANVKVRSLDPV